MKIKYPREKFIQYSVLIGCFFITIFIFSNSYETVFGKDIKYISAVEIINIDSIVTSITQQSDDISFDDELELIENFGVPTYLKIPKIVSNVQLIKVIKSSNDELLCRSNSGHYLFFEGSKNKNTENIIVYLKKSWRTIDDIGALEKDDNIFVETVDDVLYMYKVDNVRKTFANNQYVVNKTKDPILIIIIEGDDDINYVVRANFVSSQGMNNE